MITTEITSMTVLHIITETMMTLSADDDKNDKYLNADFDNYNDNIGDDDNNADFNFVSDNNGWNSDNRSGEC